MRVFASVLTFVAIALVQTGCGDAKAATAKSAIDAVVGEKTDEESNKAVKETMANYKTLPEFEKVATPIVKTLLDDKAIYAKLVEDEDFEVYSKGDEKTKAAILKQAVASIHDKMVARDTPPKKKDVSKSTQKSSDAPKNAAKKGKSTWSHYEKSSGLYV